MVQEMAALTPTAEYSSVRKILIGAANWAKSRLPEHAITSDVLFEADKAVVLISVELLGEDFERVKRMERLAQGDKTFFTLPRTDAESCKLQESGET